MATTKTTKKREKKLEVLAPAGSIFKYGEMSAMIQGDLLRVGTYDKNYGFCEEYSFCKEEVPDAFYAAEAALKEAGWIK